MSLERGPRSGGVRCVGKRIVDEISKATGSSCSNAFELRANIAVMQNTLRKKVTAAKSAKNEVKKPSTSK